MKYTGLAALMIVTGAGGVPATGQVWNLQSPASATLPGGQIESVSCSSASACTAVGTYLATSGLNRTLAQRWNGRTWQLQRTPNPAVNTVPAVDPKLLGVSCPAADFCEAVGTYQLGFVSVAMAQSWNGRGWRLQPFPVPAGSDSAALDQVSCISALFCEAVGSFDDINGTITLAATWNGTSWHLQRTPNPPGGFGASFKLTGVSCVSQQFCEAAGGSDSSGATFAQRWNGTSWRLQAMPGIGGVNSVSCVSVRFCEAVGPGTGEAWNGSSWTAQTIPGPAGNLRGVACTASTFCEAVGDFNNNGNADGQAFAWNGLAWSGQSTPNPGAATWTQLHGISCTSSRSCVAVGEFRLVVTSSDSNALAEAWNGSTWRLRRAVAPPGATSNSLAAVSCVSASFCEAVGSFTDGAGNAAGLAEAWDGTSWKVQAVPTPTSPFAPPTQMLMSVSCVTASFCEAVGTGVNGADAVVWNGTSWKRQAVPGTNVELTSVSCAGLRFCMASGAFGGITIWNGSSWSAGPSVPGFSPLLSVSCVSASFCEAVGQGPPGQGAAAWNGTTWSDQTTAGPPSVALSAVSCPAANSCEAVGSFVSQGSFRPVTLAERWNGSVWAIQPTPNPSISQTSSLRSVWCTSASSCTAVGQYQYSFLSLGRTVAEVWNGTAWSLRSTPNHLDAGQNIFNGVSCAASQKCTAVGQTQDAGLIEAPLIEAGD